jgi:hypothetical protein
MRDVSLVVMTERAVTPRLDAHAGGTYDDVVPNIFVRKKVDRNLRKNSARSYQYPDIKNLEFPEEKGGIGWHLENPCL